MNIRVDIIPAGRVNRSHIKMKPRYITVHDTANKDKGSNAEAHANYLKGVQKKVSWHVTVDDKEAVQHLPYDEAGYHAGDGGGDGNMKTIGVEICENVDGNRKKAEENAVKVIAKLLVINGLTPDNVVQHNKWSGKNCPASFRGAGTWASFLDKIKKEYENMTKPAQVMHKVYKDLPANHYSVKTIDKLLANGVKLGLTEDKIGYGEPLDLPRLLAILDKLGLIK